MQVFDRTIAKKAKATSAFASIAKSGRSVIFIDSLSASRYAAIIAGIQIVREATLFDRRRIFDHGSGSTGTALNFPDFALKKAP